MERLTMTNEEIESIRQYCEHFNCPIKAEEDDITNQFCDKVCDEFQDNCPFMKVGLKLKSYEDDEEKGLLLRPKCRLGDVVYGLWSVPTESKVVRIVFWNIYNPKQNSKEKGK